MGRVGKTYPYRAQAIGIAPVLVGLSAIHSGSAPRLTEVPPVAQTTSFAMEQGWLHSEWPPGVSIMAFPSIMHYIWGKRATPACSSEELPYPLCSPGHGCGHSKQIA